MTPTMEPRHFRGVPSARPSGGIRVEIPFDPAAVWDVRDTYHVAGTIGGHRFRGPLARGATWTLELGPGWCRHPGFEPGDVVAVELVLEGPQSMTMGLDVAEAFAAEPDAKRFFDSMPTFYRNNVARSIAGAKRPETRLKRITDAVARAKRGVREG
jgi:hypothetical protein